MSRQMQDLAVLPLSGGIFSDDRAIANLLYHCRRFPMVHEAILNQNLSRRDTRHVLHILDDIDNGLPADFYKNVTTLRGDHGLSIEFGRFSGDPRCFVRSQKHDTLKNGNDGQNAGKYTQYKSIEADGVGRSPK